MATHIWVNIDSGNGLFPDSTKPLPVPMLIYHQFGRKSSKPISQEIPHTSITKISLSITCQKFHSNPSWANEFVHDSIWSGLIKAGPNSSTDVSLLRWNVKIKCKEYFSYPMLACRSVNRPKHVVRWFPDCAITYHTCQHTAGSRSGKTS